MKERKQNEKISFYSMRAYKILNSYDACFLYALAFILLSSLSAPLPSQTHNTTQPTSISIQLLLLLLLLKHSKPRANINKR